MNTELYTIKGRSLNCIKKAGKENEQIRVVNQNIKKSKNVLVSQIDQSSYLMVEVFENNRDIRLATKKAVENKTDIHYLKINGKQQRI